MEKGLLCALTAVRSLAELQHLYNKLFRAYPQKDTGGFYLCSGTARVQDGAANLQP